MSLTNLQWTGRTDAATGDVDNQPTDDSLKNQPVTAKVMTMAETGTSGAAGNGIRLMASAAPENITAAYYFINLSDESSEPGEGEEGQQPGGGEEGQQPGGGEEGQQPGGGEEGQQPGEGEEIQQPGGGEEDQQPGEGEESQQPGEGEESQQPAEAKKTSSRVRARKFRRPEIQKMTRTVRTLRMTSKRKIRIMRHLSRQIKMLYRPETQLRQQASRCCSLLWQCRQQQVLRHFGSAENTESKTT